MASRNNPLFMEIVQYETLEAAFEAEARRLAVTTGMKKADIIALLEEDDATN